MFFTTKSYLDGAQMQPRPMFPNTDFNRKLTHLTQKAGLNCHAGGPRVRIFGRGCSRHGDYHYIDDLGCTGSWNGPFVYGHIRVPGDGETSYRLPG